MVENINGNKLVYTIKYGDNLTHIAKKYNTNIETILKLNPGISDKNLIYTGNKLVLENNEIFIQKEDYSPQNMNMGTITIGGKEITQLSGKNMKSNFYANNLALLSTESLNDDDSATKIVIEMQAGKSMTRKDNDTPYSILNKVIGDHLNNNSRIVVNENGEIIPENQWLENTDLYKVFISEDVNGDNFTGENNKLLPRGACANNVQIPSVEIDKNGTKYFTLHGNNEIFYFDETGKQVEFNNGIIEDASEIQASAQPVVTDTGAERILPPSAPDFDPYNDYKENALNIGEFFVNGEIQNNEGLKSNFYQNNINNFMKQTLNDQSPASRLDIQLNIGSGISQRDLSAVDILKKSLGNNYNKASFVEKISNGQYTAKNTPLQDTDLYRAFVSPEVNGNNFENNTIIKNESGSNIVQFPALEADANGVKYYTLQANDGQILYFNDNGQEIKVN